MLSKFIYASFTAAPLIAVIAAIRFFAVYRVPKKTFYILWGIVLCSLFVPFGVLPRLNITGHIGGLGESKETAEFVSNAADKTAETVSPSVQGVISDIYGTVDRFGRDMKDIFERIDMAAAPAADAGIVAQTPGNTAKTSNYHFDISPISPIFLVWLAGCMAFAIYFAFTHIRFRRKYVESLPLENPFAQSWIKKHFCPAKRKIQFKESDMIVSPLTYGIFRPVILLPATTDYSDEKKLEYILLHEYTHIRRFDTLAKLLLAAALCLHWFNPFVWLMYILANRDIELSCDETVVKKIKADTGANTKSDYAMALISLAEKKRFAGLLPSHFSKNILKERIRSVMKTKKTTMARVLLAAILVFMVGALFAALQSCGGNEAEEPFVMQEPTGKLVVYKNYAANERILTSALNIFREKYPDVEIEVREFDNEDAMEGLNEYRKTLKTELAAGQGPDLILGRLDSDFPDIYKTMDAGAFLDLNPFIENDEDFTLDDYVKAVLDAGVYKGKRYIMPVEYIVPILFTTQEILDAEGIKASDLATFDGFMKTLENYNGKYKDNPGKTAFRKSDWIDMMVWYSFPWCGIDLIDYSAKKTNVDNPYFKSMMESTKSLYVSKEDSGSGFYGPEITVSALKNQDNLFEVMTDSSSGYVYGTYSHSLENKLNPAFFKYPDISGKTTAKVHKAAAIPKTSQNQINAYNLLKIILSTEIQADYSTYLITPVSKKAIRTIAEMYAMYGYDFEYEGNEYHRPPFDPPIPEKAFNEYLDIALNPDSCKMTAYTPYYEILMRDMAPYFEGKKSFEECAAILKNNLELYLSE